MCISLQVFESEPKNLNSTDQLVSILVGSLKLPAQFAAVRGGFLPASARPGLVPVAHPRGRRGPQRARRPRHEEDARAAPPHLDGRTAAQPRRNYCLGLGTVMLGENYILPKPT